MSVRHALPAPLDHRQAMALQQHELERAVEVLGSLTPHDWSAPTECPAWDVRRMYLHVLGACEAGASTTESVRQMVSAFRRRRREGGPLEAALSATQVAAREHLTPTELVDRLRDVAPRCVAGRQRMPGFLRAHVSMKVDGPVVERWRLGYLVDTIYLRDLWLHRVDLCRAVGRPFECTADHDGVIVADVVQEWAARHGQPFRLVLTGPAGGEFAVGADGDRIATDALELDAVEFCRVVGGRARGDGLLATIVPF